MGRKKKEIGADESVVVEDITPVVEETEAVSMRWNSDYLEFGIYA